MADLIDRAAALDFKVSHGIRENCTLYVPYVEVKRYLEQLPTAERKGHWKNTYAITEYRYRCSECFANHRARYDYCPSCGARMERE